MIIAAIASDPAPIPFRSGCAVGEYIRDSEMHALTFPCCMPRSLRGPQGLCASLWRKAMRM